MTGPKTELVISTRDFFTEMIEDAFSQRKIKSFPFARHYLVTLLEHFVSTNNLFDEEKEDGRKDRKTLAELFLTATNMETGVRLDLLKKLGDTSLYVSGFFGESLQRKLVDIDYYANMGGLAYGNLSSHVKEDNFRRVYQEFSNRFLEYVEVLTFVSQKMMVQSDDNILRLYDRYLRTGSELAKDALLEKGINPVPKTSKGFHQ